MPMVKPNGAELYYELSGEGDIPVVMVHGGAGSHDVWTPLVSELNDSFRIVNYDRRGHGQSELPGESMSAQDHLDDLAGLIEELNMKPAWVVANSSGGAVALRLAGTRPDVFRGMIAHEPALFGLLGDDPATAPMTQQAFGAVTAVLEKVSAGDHSGAAETFCETIVGEAWDPLPREMQQMIIENLPVVVKDDLEILQCDPEQVGSFQRPVLLTTGDETPPIYPAVIDKLVQVLPEPDVVTLNGAGHVPQITHPQQFADVIRDFTSKNPG